MIPRPLAAGTVLHRIHGEGRAGNRFNPCLGKPGRFSPLRTPAAGCIPSLYAATSLDAAVYETILHDIDLADPFAFVPRDALDGLAHSHLLTVRTLRLAPLHRPELAARQLDHAALFLPLASAHDACRALGAALHGEAADLDGLLWTSVRDDAASAILLFGDRVGEADLACEKTRSAAEDAGLLGEIAAAFERSGVTLLR